MGNWKALVGYEEQYEINTDGQIKRIKGTHANRILKVKLDRGGYWRVKISKDGATKTKYIHRLLAQTFILNPANKDFVNHINGIKNDNSLENLEWVTHSENMLHAYRTGLCTLNLKAKQVIDKCTGAIFKSIKEAADSCNISYASCKNYLNGSRKNPTCLELYTKI